MNRNIIFIGGINGVGKTTIARELSSELNIPFIEGSHNLMKTLGLDIGDYDSLRSLAHDKKREGQTQSFKSISESHERAIMSSHYVQIIEGTIVDSVGDWYSYCSHLIYLSANPKDILARIEAEDRDRKLFKSNLISKEEKLEFLKMAQDRSLEIAYNLSLKHKIPLIEVENSNIQKSVAKIKRALSESN